MQGGVPKNSAPESYPISRKAKNWGDFQCLPKISQSFYSPLPQLFPKMIFDLFWDIPEIPQILLPALSKTF